MTSSSTLDGVAMTLEVARSLAAARILHAAA